ncbi:uncharacterized protein LOC111624801 [Centruroides sculpturatus]|uniref:uncharacterized protein LOC111624801 n=1 Tax=Centruroides sculpturatus TaxID=218467 RepID=UPI000C6DB45A|nr:uncharacterized protein LOC111624801 [Centruroides sculpturatus]XP_023223522.1 uncharacterized protein LOC111624801 [Centruroides sculpturatus]XP_023223523.1 uncharacterized protein LOC111624801 [Centruroides sculpturatus]
MDSNKCEEHLEVVQVSDNKEQDINYDIISSFEGKKANQKLYIKTKDSIIHLGTKVVLEVQNEKDIEKLQPYLQGLKREILQEKPTGLKYERDIINETNTINNGTESNDDKENVNKEDCNLKCADPHPFDEIGLNEKDQLSEDGTNLDKLSLDLKISKENDECLLTPEYFKSPSCIYSSASVPSNSNQIYENINSTIASLNFTTAQTNSFVTSSNVSSPSCIQTANTKVFLNQNKNHDDNQNLFNATNNSQIPHFGFDSIKMNNSSFIQGHSSTSFQVTDSCINSDENLKHGYSYYAHNEQNLERFQPSFPPKNSYSSTSQHPKSIIKCPNDYFTNSYDGARKQSGFPFVSSNTPVSISCTTNSIKPSTDNFSKFTINKTKVQKSLSLLAEVSDQSSLQLNSHTENKSSWFPRERLLKTRPKNDWKPLGVNFMEERNFKLGIIPGKFYDTSNGVLVEMQNGKNYTIFLVNDNKEQCDVDVFVDTHIVAKLRLEGNSTEYIEGPRYDTMKFMFVRARDAPPEAEILYNDEGNGLIEVIFKPEKKNTVNRKLRERAWSADSNGNINLSIFLFN